MAAHSLLDLLLLARKEPQSGSVDPQACNLYQASAEAIKEFTEQPISGGNLASCLPPELAFRRLQILGGVAEGALPLAGCEGVLLDALKVLACKEIRGGAQPRGGPDDEGPDEGGGGPGAAASAAKGRLVSQLMKKNLMENVVPILIELKRYALQETAPRGALR
jgi:hypothetical protein